MEMNHAIERAGVLIDLGDQTFHGIQDPQVFAICSGTRSAIQMVTTTFDDTHQRSVANIQFSDRTVISTRDPNVVIVYANSTWRTYMVDFGRNESDWRARYRVELTYS